MEITSKIDSLGKKNEELTSHVTVAQNTSKILQEGFNTTSSKLVELERQHHKLEQYSRRECFDFSSIPSSVAPKDLDNFILCILMEIGADLDKSRIVPCHRLGKTDRTIVKFFNRKDAENVYSNKKKLKDVDISCLFSDGIQDRKRHDHRESRRLEGGLSVMKKKSFYTTKSLSVIQIFVWLVKEKEAEGVIFYFWVFNGTIRMRKLLDLRVINITHESDTDTFLVIFLDKPSLLGWKKGSFFITESYFVIFYKLLHVLLFTR